MVYLDAVKLGECAVAPTVNRHLFFRPPGGLTTPRLLGVFQREFFAAAPFLGTIASFWRAFVVHHRLIGQSSLIAGLFS